MTKNTNAPILNDQPKGEDPPREKIEEKERKKRGNTFQGTGVKEVQK